MIEKRKRKMVNGNLFTFPTPFSPPNMKDGKDSRLKEKESLRSAADNGSLFDERALSLPKDMDLSLGFNGESMGLN